ncbi:response regulator transcription factor [Rhizobium leguminosarum]|uniref:response regulator transcription factor n=1 Tax=Rhizobium leguminosarum TaxID=384 RepID=UPI001C95A564|nr:response regulator [Rhizobium leguminosarum]MBY5705717.1 response regulator transcription factor [Rhizobium leguminosarum]
MKEDDCIVYVVDDDERMRVAICDLLEAKGINTHAFGSIVEYTAFSRPDLPGCLILDIELPMISGLEFQMQVDQDAHPPIVFITGYGDIPTTVKAIKRGAVNFLTKPFEQLELLDSINSAFEQDRLKRRDAATVAVLKERLATLTPRERDVLPLIVGGLLNKQAAAQLGISEVTLQIHRSRVMHKMQASSVAELVRMSEKLKLSSDTPVDARQNQRRSLS